MMCWLWVTVVLALTGFPSLAAATFSVSSPRSIRGAYIHVPFCRRRCFYCNFPIVVVGDRPSTQQQQGEAYTELLLREIDLTISTVQQDMPDKTAPLASVYFGGGTPSLLPVHCFRTILARLSPWCDQNTEITLELDPGTFTTSKLQELEEAGVTRLSIGIQSFDNDILIGCGRAHTAEDSLRAIDTIHRSPTRFKDNFSLDLISSLPTLTLPLWEKTLRHVVSTGCSHVSVYDLQVEDKTAFGRWYSPGVFPLPTDSDSAAMYRLAAEILTSTESGFEHYEVSNYAKPGKRSTHNQLYWQCQPCLGFGMGAASYIHNRRYTRPAKLPLYQTWLNRLESEGLDAASYTDDVEDDDDDDEGGSDKGIDTVSVSAESTDRPDILEVVMLALRTSDGLNLITLGQEYGVDAVQRVLTAVDPFVSRGLVAVGHNNSDSDSSSCTSVRLVDPDGFLLSNDIISSVFVELTS